MQSARGVFYDLLDSNYIYLHGNIRFYFSSKFYLNKFSLKIDEFIKNEKMKFLVNYKIDIDAEILFMITLYRKIEKRGFRVVYKGKELEDKLKFKLELEV